MNDRGDGRLHYAATARNRGPILAELDRLLPRPATVLEIASGSGEHAVWFAGRLSALSWQPSDPDPAARASIAAWTAHAAAGNVLPPIALDCRAARWRLPPGADYAAVVCINMIHIAPWESCAGLLAGSGRVLHAGGVLYLYGPFRRAGHHTAPSNARFDDALRTRDPAWGVRDLDAVAALADTHGLALDAVVEMPANNLSVVFRARGAAARETPP